MLRIRVGEIEAQLNRKAIKNLHISVLPPDGRVRVSAPEQMTDTAIRMAVINRIPWIKQQQRDFANQPRQTERQMVSGESHFLWGKHYRLNVIEQAGRHKVTVAAGKVNLYVNANTTAANKTKLLDQYSRDVLKERIATLLDYWQEQIGVSPSAWGVRKMKTKWGSCNTEAKRIWLNLELAKKPPECLEYILVHELIHLLERNHNARFKANMDKFIPDWQERRQLLNRMPLSHSEWSMS